MLDKPLEMKGYWWLPETPDLRIGGTVKYDPSQGLSLDLFGALHPILSSERNKAIPLIHGLEDGKEVTLLCPRYSLQRQSTTLRGSRRSSSGWLPCCARHITDWGG